MNRYAWVWPVLVVIWTAAACGLVLAGAESPLRAVVGLGFMLIVPGLAFVPLLGAIDRLLAAGLVAAISLGLNTLVGEAMLYGGVWSPTGGLIVVAVLSLGGAALQAALIGRAVARRREKSRKAASPLRRTARTVSPDRAEGRRDAAIVTDSRSAR